MHTQKCKKVVRACQSSSVCTQLTVLRRGLLLEATSENTCVGVQRVCGDFDKEYIWLLKILIKNVMCFCLKMNSLHDSTAGRRVARSNHSFNPKFSPFISISQQKRDIHWTSHYVTNQTFLLVFCLNKGSRRKNVKLIHFTGSFAALLY